MRRSLTAPILAAILCIGPAGAQFIGDGVFRTVAAGTPLSISATASVFSDPTSVPANHIIYTSQAIGTADASRIVVWAYSGNVGAGGGLDPTGVTIGGATATKLISTISGAESCEILYAAISVGTTATIDMDYTGSNPPD